MSAIITGYMSNNQNDFQTFIDGRASGTGGATETFAEAMGKKEAETARFFGQSSVQTMSMEEYKQYIAQMIQRIPVHPSRRYETFFVNISEAGYAAMRKDPEYEAWVLNDLRANLAQPDFSCGNCGRTYTNIYYGATKEEHRTETWSTNFGNERNRFWERRMEQKRRLERRLRKKKIRKQLLELALQRQAYQRAIVKKLIEHRREIEKENRQRWKTKKIKDKPDGSRVLEITAKEKGMEKLTELQLVRVEEVLQEIQWQQDILNQKYFEQYFFN